MCINHVFHLHLKNILDFKKIAWTSTKKQVLKGDHQLLCELFKLPWNTNLRNTEQHSHVEIWYLKAPHTTILFLSPIQLCDPWSMKTKIYNIVHEPSTHVHYLIIQQ